MSYLSALRLHFAGHFIANVPTIDNYPENHIAASKGQPIIKPGFNPQGTGEFSLPDCIVKSAFYQDGTAVDKDPIVGMTVADAGTGPAAKIVDLDPDQQTVPVIYGLEVRLLDAASNIVLRAEFEPAAARDMWTRCPQIGTNAFGLGAAYQSVLTDLEWVNPVIDEKQQTLAGSQFLFQLFQLAPDGGKLSIKLNLDAFRTQNRGRIVGTIGLYDADEPRHFIRGRHLLAPLTSDSQPQNSLYDGVAILDDVTRSIRVDLGNSMPMDRTAMLLYLGKMNLVYDKLDGDGSFLERVSLQQIDYASKPNWYETCAGVVDVPVSQDQFDDLGKYPVGITLPNGNDNVALALCEAPKGLHVRSETTVCRLDPGYSGSDKETIRFLATRYGEPLPDARIVLFFAPTVPGSDTGLDFDRCIATDANGWATVELQADPSVTRGDFTDSRLYRVRYALEETLAPSPQSPFVLSDEINVLVWEVFEPEAGETTWWGTVQPIFQKYAILFPAMKARLDLTDYDVVCANSQKFISVLSLPVENAHHMPVNRDLSPSKRQALLDWLSQPGANGKPLLGTPP